MLGPSPQDPRVYRTISSVHTLRKRFQGRHGISQELAVVGAPRTSQGQARGETDVPSVLRSKECVYASGEGLPGPQYRMRVRRWGLVGVQLAG